MLTIDGLASGLDTTSIIEGLTSIYQIQIDRLVGQQQTISAEQTAFKGIEARLLTLQASTTQLSRIQNNVFASKKVSSTDESIVAGSAGDDAVAGVYNLRINSLARAHQIASQGFEDSDSTITQGTLTVSVGNGAESTITIDNTNNTLQGLADAINNSGTEVSASIINDGSATGFRLLLSSTKTGTANAISITNNLATSNGDAIRPVFLGTATAPSSIAPVAPGLNYGAAANPISNIGIGDYTGPDNDTYTFTFLESGIIGDDDVQISYTDGSGDNTGTINYKKGDAGTFKAVAEGLNMKFESGGVAVTGNNFTVAVSNDDTSIAAASTVSPYNADSTPSSNDATGTYTGPDNDTYTFTILESGMIGVTDIQIAYTDGSGDNTGTINYKKGDAGTFKTITEGVEIKLEEGFVVNGDTFTVAVSSDDTSIAAAVAGAGFGADATPSVNAGTGAYTGSDDDIYTFTITQGGVVGEASIQISYSDGSGDNTGTITYDPLDVGSLKTVAEGLQIQFETGLAEVGDTFTVAVTAETQTTVDPVQDPTDASITLGSGAGAIIIVNDTNQIEDVIPGVTLSLLSADSNKEITLTVSEDVEAAKTAITGFVDSFNDVMQFIDDQVRYDAETNQASVLLGNRSVTSIQDEVRSSMFEVVGGVSTDMNRLSALGITVNSNGRLSVNSAQLDDVLAGNVDGVTMDDIHRLFALDGQSDNGNIRFVSGSEKTIENATPYEVDISQVAERATITATNALAASTVIDNTNNTLTITVDGKASSTLTLSDGTYTRQELAAHLEAVINADTELTGKQVSIAVENDRLKITSDLYGATSFVAIGTGTAISELGFSGTETDNGQNVAGRFLVDGIEETATSIGQLLIGDSENANTADLQVRVSLTSGQVLPGFEASLTVTRGIASRLATIFDGYFDPVTGKIKTVNDGFDDQISDIQESIDRQNESLQTRQEALAREFLALETAISELQSTGNFLTAQLAALSNTRTR